MITDCCRVRYFRASVVVLASVASWGCGGSAGGPDSTRETGSASSSESAPTVATGTGISSVPVSGRRLTREEYLTTIRSLFGTVAAVQVATAAPGLDDVPTEPSSSQSGIAERAASAHYVTASQVAASAVASATPWAELAAFASCTTDFSATCQNDFIATVGRALYRRSLTPAEIANLSVVYTGSPNQPGPNDPASNDPTPFQTGSRLAVEAMLLSPTFLYQLEAPPTLEQPATPAAPEVTARPGLAR